MGIELTPLYLQSKHTSTRPGRLAHDNTHRNKNKIEIELKI